MVGEDKGLDSSLGCNKYNASASRAWLPVMAVFVTPDLLPHFGLVAATCPGMRIVGTGIAFVLLRDFIHSKSRTTHDVVSTQRELERSQR